MDSALRRRLCVVGSASSALRLELCVVGSASSTLFQQICKPSEEPMMGAKKYIMAVLPALNDANGPLEHRW